MIGRLRSRRQRRPERRPNRGLTADQIGFGSTAELLAVWEEAEKLAEAGERGDE